MIEGAEGIVWLNDALVNASEARISPFDRGFLYGDGLFETMRLYRAIPCLLDRHLRRLYASAARIKLELPERKCLEEMIYAVIEANQWSDARLRLTVSRGIDHRDTLCRRVESTIFIYGRPLLQNEVQPKPINLKTTLYTHQPSPFQTRLKSLNYLVEILSLDAAQAKGATEGVFLTNDGYVAEGGMSNIFCNNHGRLLTPPLDLGILPGIARERILEIGVAQGIDIYEERFPLQTLKDADEVFITNSVREILPVKSVEGEKIKGKVPGKLTIELQRLYRASVIQM